MYAIIEDGGRQLKVEEGQEIQIDFRDIEPGEKITFDRILALRDDAGITLGRPTLAGGTVTAEVLGEDKGPKLVVQKLRRRKNSRRKTGHRQSYTRVRIEKINAG
ncbi:MAG: 50S ribosomal protein L21 [Pirellulales bacterium]|nr:50S ribosomal protein L21 [Pirellulales bacterium]